jgi:NAD(P)-dependent dehydrogenase (short-subunit alcohol dehydrogenase family)
MVGLVKSAALEMGSANVTINAINPGPTNTAMVRKYLTAEQWEQRKKFDPLGQLSEPEDIAEMVLFLAAAGGRFITGQLFTTRMRAG